jgi:transcriptional regulator with XRE-family HTH domain
VVEVATVGGSMSEPSGVLALHRPGARRVRRPRREPLWRHVVGEVLRVERQSQGRTLRDVSDEAQVSMAYLSEIERGRKEPSSEILAAAAHALGLTLAEVVHRADALLAPPAEQEPEAVSPVGRTLDLTTRHTLRPASPPDRVQGPGSQVTLAA